MKKTLTVFCVLLLTIAFSCNDNNNIIEQKEIKVNEKGITTLINFIDFNIDQLAANGFSDYGNQEAVAKIVAANSPAFEKQYGVSITVGSKNARSLSDEQEYTTSKDSEFGQKLLSFSKTSANKDEYLSKLTLLKNEIYSYKINDTEKQILMTKVVLIERLINYMDTKAAIGVTKNLKTNTNAKADPKNPSKDTCTGWWQCWGKCVAGTVGGTLTGSVVGCGAIGAVGAVVGLVGGPAGAAGGAAVGCVGGAFVGAIGGGLQGAAQYCG